MLPLNTIVCGDNIAVMREWPDSCIDLTVTSPPYDNVYYSPNGNLITDSGNGLRTYEGYTWDFAAVARELWRVTKMGGVVVWVVGDATVNGSETGSSFRQALYFMGLGFRLHDTMIYQADKPPLTHNRYEQSFEYMFIFSKGDTRVFNPIKELTIHKGVSFSMKGKAAAFEQGASIRKGQNREASICKPEKIKQNIWHFRTGRTVSNSERFIFVHPAIFPESLAHDHIISWSNPGAIILDPFCGSGTTAKIAAILGRNYIGIDCSESYCNLARRRVANVERELRGEWKPLQDTGGAFDGLPLLEGIEG